MPTNFLLLPIGLIVCGWNIIRAYGSPFSLSLSLFHAFVFLPSRSGSPALPETLYLLFFYFLFFDRYLRFFGPRGTRVGVTDPVEARNPSSSLWHAYFHASRPMNPFFCDRLRLRKLIGRHVEYSKSQHGNAIDSTRPSPRFHWQLHYKFGAKLWFYYSIYSVIM